jgi:hypothetical protein
VIRPGQRTPYRKGTRGQVEERTQAAGLLLFLGLSKTAIHRLFREKFNVQWRQCDRYLAGARARSVSVFR